MKLSQKNHREKYCDVCGKNQKDHHSHIKSAKHIKKAEKTEKTANNSEALISTTSSQNVIDDPETIPHENPEELQRQQIASLNCPWKNSRPMDFVRCAPIATNVLTKNIEIKSGGLIKLNHGARKF